jgi:AcrR family transcriptional regulator
MAEDTRRRLIDGAIETVRRNGIAGTSARTVAATAGVNQALVFYHFGGVDGLLLAALDVSAAERLGRYQAELAAAPSTREKVDAARRLYREDVEGGHVTVIAELLGASLARPELRPALIERMRPWLALVTGVLHEVAGDSPLATLVPVEDVASALVALYFGLNLLSRLDPDNVHADSLFDVMERLAQVLEP